MRLTSDKISKNSNLMQGAGAGASQDPLNGAWATYNILLLLSAILAFWMIGPARFPDYENYVRAAADGYDSFFEYFPHLFFELEDLASEPGARVNYFIAFVHVLFIITFISLTILAPRQGFFLAMYLSCYLPFFVTTGVRAAFAYILGGVAASIAINAGRKGVAIFFAVAACLFHDSAAFSVALLIGVSIIPGRARSSIVRLTVLFIFSALACSLVWGGGVVFEEQRWLGRFSDYLLGSLNSYDKLFFIYANIFLSLFAGIILKTDSEALLLFCMGAVGVCLVTIINQVAGIRLLPFVMAPGLILISELAKRYFSGSAIVAMPLFFLFFLFNYWDLAY